VGCGGARQDYEVNRERHWISSACLRGLCLALSRRLLMRGN